MRPTTFISLGVGFGALRANPLRSGLSTLGVVMGTAALVAVLSVGDGVERFAREQLGRTTGLQTIQVVALPTREVDGVQVPNLEVPRLGVAEAREVAGLVPAGTAVALVRTGAGLATVPGGGRPRGVLVQARWGRPPVEALAAGRTVEAGEAAPVAVVSHSLARLLADGRPVAEVVGDTVRLGDLALTIVGVRDSVPVAGGFGVTVPFELGDRVMAPSMPPRLASITATAPTLEAVALIKARLESWVAGHERPWREAVAVRSQEQRLAQAVQGALVFKILMGTVAGVSLLVGGIGIMNVLLAAVAERTREIGIRKAAGARRRDVLLQFLVESTAIAGVGAAMGVGAGYVIAASGAAVMRARAGAPVYAGLSPSTVGVAALAAIAIGVAFGMYPALRAARLDPIEAIRHE